MARHPEAIRFAVGTPADVRSWVWRMWAHRDEIYIRARDALTVFKVSLHNSGVWRIAFVADLERDDAASDRVITRWKKPGEFAPGWTPSVGIVVSWVHPRQPFRQKPTDDKRVRFYAPPKPGNRLLFKVLFSRSGGSEADLARITRDGDQLVARLEKRNGEVAWLVLREDALQPVEDEKIRDVMAKTKIHLQPGSSANALIGSRALLVVAADSPGVADQPTILDIPLGMENVESA
jgi:hypothetical protein